MTTEKILDKLAKLKAARDGEAKIGNQAAAEAFAEAINRLLIQHELSEADIQMPAEQDPIVEHFVTPMMMKEHGVKYGRSRIGWQEALASLVARAHLCRLLVHPGSNAVTFVGTKAHVTVAEYAFLVLVAAADRMSIQARHEWWRDVHGGAHVESNGFRASWLSGFVRRIGERFEEARRAEVIAAAVGESTALMCLNKALVRAGDYIDEKYKKKSAPTKIGGANMDGYRAGRAAADKMKLGQRGVEGKNVPKIGGGR